MGTICGTGYDGNPGGPRWWEKAAEILGMSLCDPLLEVYAPNLLRVDDSIAELFRQRYGVNPRTNPDHKHLTGPLGAEHEDMVWPGVLVLRFRAGQLGSPAVYDGNPTWWEKIDATWFMAKSDICWYHEQLGFADGFTADRPIRISDPTQPAGLLLKQSVPPWGCHRYELNAPPGAVQPPQKPPVEPKPCDPCPPPVACPEFLPADLLTEARDLAGRLDWPLDSRVGMGRRATLDRLRKLLARLLPAR